MPRGYQAYSEYQASEFEWLGKLPTGWRVGSLKHVVDQARKITYGIVQAGPNIENGIPYIRPADMTDEHGVKNYDGLLRTSESVANGYERSQVKTGDIVCSIGPSFGKLMIVPEKLEGANLTQGTARVAVDSNYVSRFFFWALRSQSSFQQWESSIGGATFRALNLGPLAETRLAIPSKDEQLQIASFLDHETAKIDTLIEKQQQLIKLLKEKRQAVISQAVTKGLASNVPMRDSGVEWLGEVPEHWFNVPIKYMALDKKSLFLDGDWIESKDMSEDGMRYVTTGNVGEGRYKEQGTGYISNETFQKLNCTEVFKGDILISRLNAPIGRACVIPDLESRIVTSVDNVIFRPDAQFFKNYLVHLFSSQDYFKHTANLARGATMQRISRGLLGNIRIVLPPLNEQIEISDFIDAELATIDALIDKAQTVIDLTAERRTALISAAVTGKIDVRGWQAPQGNQSNMEPAA